MVNTAKAHGKSQHSEFECQLSLLIQKPGYSPNGLYSISFNIISCIIIVNEDLRYCMNE